VVDGDGAVFVFALPYDPGLDGTLERIVLSGPDGEDTLTPGSTRPMAIMRTGSTARFARSCATGTAPCRRASGAPAGRSRST